MLLVDDLAAGGTKNLRHTPRGLVTLMICNNNYLVDILRVCEIKDLIWVMRFQSP